MEVPSVSRMEVVSPSYTGDGNPKMDKERSRYCRDDQELTIESAFICDVPVKEPIKAYILEVWRNGNGMAVRSSECYNKSNMIVAPPKEVC